MQTATYDRVGTGYYGRAGAGCAPFEGRALLTVKEMCSYLGIGQTKCRQLLADPSNGFTIRIGGRLYAHRKSLDAWLDSRIG